LDNKVFKNKHTIDNENISKKAQPIQPIFGLKRSLTRNNKRNFKFN